LAVYALERLGPIWAEKYFIECLGVFVAVGGHGAALSMRLGEDDRGFFLDERAMEHDPQRSLRRLEEKIRAWAWSLERAEPMVVGL
jgi:hypothetical protein